MYRDSKTNSCHEREGLCQRLDRQESRAAGPLLTAAPLILLDPPTLSVPHLDQRTPAASFQPLPSSPSRVRVFTLNQLDVERQPHQPSFSAFSLLTSAHSQKARTHPGGETSWGFIQFYYYYAYRHACGSSQSAEFDPDDPTETLDRDVGLMKQTSGRWRVAGWINSRRSRILPRFLSPDERRKQRVPISSSQSADSIDTRDKFFSLKKNYNFCILKIYVVINSLPLQFF